MIKKSIVLFIGICVLASVAQSQTTSSKTAPLILITSENHEPIKTLNDISEISKNLPNIKAISITSENVEAFITQLKEIVKGLKVNKQQMSSLMIEHADLQKIQNIDFIDLPKIQDIKAAIESEGKNLLIYIIQKVKETRKLVENGEYVPTSDDPTKEPVSQLFVNMNAATLTGLLVSLFLIIMLIIAIKCLYDVKTNDQFPRVNLWVGKES